MSELKLDDDATPMTPVPTDPLWVERNGTRTYTGFSGRGARVDIGPASAGAVFTPGELLKIALAACAGMSADSKFARVLGDDFSVTIRVNGPKHATEDRYPELHDTFEIDLSSLDEATRDKTLMLAQRSIDRACTVGNTLKAGAVVPPVEYVQPLDEPGPFAEEI
ncbi:OsmC family protein [Xylanimonas cellulosilytica DSM 15894]|uniref:OsmC family protein n=1 Tax=Xylanimonas cellulosilytica (strain DSM 15894 / JCM 12276 / CECT 5975 / KCTC 9989 / LMG 20990 / NBRC 107835 / XIL07) TaxID=446471 RepID=D1BYI1_XYLCX|nr:OsmC family protein [Xylanimonas cellulosilytica]ACZ31853.1 OsmC family protein [Xylanimonas cellulosilytica DSM 15894]